ncbi:class I SAM-dependent DNA methyltransferase [Jidongwangia harbinensis]|uniref:class I SAM-dependent DNA methyltransferase n=1 Tax=Jidongwangia harbinensis TaxID=2878561 RepID=UPI001CD9B190|nr:class I SAM-dependent methyltransferase [Jidongwangia harbinensis]MCA2215699.1 class I SAM-dependent methyltransferase [Jidongwangia harbinensis]
MNDLDRTRASYDTVAASYSALADGDLVRQPVERAMLTLFAELASGPALDAGCGPGHVTAYLHQQGLEVSGVDLSPGMVAQARSNHPGLRFDVGSMTALDHPDGSLGGLIAYLSIIHIPDAELPAVLGGFHQVLTAGAPLLLAFQVGDGPKPIAEAWGHEVDLTLYRRRPETVAAMLTGAGFRMVLNAVFDVEERPGMVVAFLIARKLG